eukprot:TRINITY_DN1035_c0_g1_i1.p1 TRINITY_DN1035_c0_g1~~TRINITY_DN1035_c0_g1_i1.p1  ORF type:complete len:521 (+),score=158.54 TRINITY_DN1035_c0_g1_i1:30-1565(+)
MKRKRSSETSENHIRKKQRIDKSEKKQKKKPHIDDLDSDEEHHFLSRVVLQKEGLMLDGEGDDLEKRVRGERRSVSSEDDGGRDERRESSDGSVEKVEKGSGSSSLDSVSSEDDGGRDERRESSDGSVEKVEKGSGGSSLDSEEIDASVEVEKKDEKSSSLDSEGLERIVGVENSGSSDDSLDADEPGKNNSSSGSSHSSKSDEDSDESSEISSDERANREYRSVAVGTGLKTGRFTQSESLAIQRSLKDFCHGKFPDLSFEEALDVLFNSKTRFKRGEWKVIAEVLPDRDIKSIVHHAKNVLNPRKKGKYTKEQEETLKNLVDKYGKRWTLISNKMKESGKTASSLRIKWEQMTHSDEKQGAWSDEEEKKFIEILKSLFDGELPPNGNGVPWKYVKTKLKTRTINQMRRKLDTLNVSRPEKLWTKEDTKILILKVFEQRPESEDDIQFQGISKSWPVYTIYYRWGTVKKYLKNSDTLSGRKIVLGLLKKFKLNDEDTREEIMRSETWENW